MASQARTLNSSTATLANAADSGAATVGEFLHEGAKQIGSAVPDSIVKPSEPVAEEDKSDLRKMAEDAYNQASIAAQGVVKATVTVGGALSESAHRTVEHNFGKEADGVARGEQTAQVQ